MSRLGRVTLFQAFTSSGLGMLLFRGLHDPAETKAAGQSAARTVSEAVTVPDHRRRRDAADGSRLQAPNRALISIAMADNALFFRGGL
jgi:hypothetical protein